MPETPTPEPPKRAGIVKEIGGSNTKYMEGQQFENYARSYPDRVRELHEGDFISQIGEVKYYYEPDRSKSIRDIGGIPVRRGE